MDPEDYETRLIPMCTGLGLGRLGVFGLETPDLALTNLASRQEEHDLTMKLRERQVLR